jgi:hypothetical protein
VDPFSPDILQRIAQARPGRERISDPDYWRHLNPDCRISENPFSGVAPPYAIPVAQVAANLARIRKEGYFQTGPILDPAEVDRLRDCIETVVDNGHDAAYALVYDDFYQVMARLTNVLQPVLGSGFQLVPDEFWAYLIPVQDGAAGTPPHRDNLKATKAFDDQGTPLLLNVWIPLTDATTDNSCIYVIPGHLDERYRSARAGAELALGQAAAEGLRPGDLQSVRALPAAAGSVLCWSTSLLHWGGRSSAHASHPRISFAVYFQSRSIPLCHEVTMDIPSPLPFARRLLLIEKLWREVGRV